MDKKNVALVESNYLLMKHCSLCQSVLSGSRKQWMKPNIGAFRMNITVIHVIVSTKRISFSTQQRSGMCGFVPCSL